MRRAGDEKRTACGASRSLADRRLARGGRCELRGLGFRQLLRGDGADGTERALSAQVQTPSDKSSRSAAWLVAALSLLAAAGVWLWQSAPHRWAEPDLQRGEMYQRALANVRASCEPLKPDLETYCREQATLLLGFPECDAECVVLVRSIRREPRR